MKTGYVILSAASIASLLLSSCASYQRTADSEAWGIKPVFNVRHSAETPESYYQLGRYYQGQRRYEQAMTAYQKALAIDSGFVEARNGLGVIYSLQGKHQEAKDKYKKVLTLDPNSAAANNNLAWIIASEKDGDLGEALRLAMLAKQAMPDEPHIADTLGFVHLKRQSYPLAIAQFQLALDPHAQALADALDAGHGPRAEHQPVEDHAASVLPVLDLKAQLPHVVAAAGAGLIDPRHAADVGALGHGLVLTDAVDLVEVDLHLTPRLPRPAGRG